mgnify:CR=1 FL=1
MKIAIFSDNFYPELSGIADSIILLARELAKLNHEINFYVPNYQPKDYQALNLVNSELELGPKIKIKRLFSLPARFISDYSRIVIPMPWRWLFNNFKPDIIHTQLFFGVGLEALAGLVDHGADAGGRSVDLADHDADHAAAARDP